MQPSAIMPFTSTEWRTLSRSILRSGAMLNSGGRSCPPRLKKTSRPNSATGIFSVTYFIRTTRGAEYPAEHNVGHLYEAKPALRKFYESLDSNNAFNPGIGKTSKQKRVI